MRLNSQIGKSLLEAFGVLFAVSCVLGFGFSKYMQDRHHRNMLDITEIMHGFFDKYQEQAAEIFKQSSPPSGASLIKTYHLLDECKEAPSIFNKYKTVCAFGLGELDISTDVNIDEAQSYVYVHFLDMYKKYSCRQFLSVGWEKVLPKTLWNDTGYIGVISENTKGKMYFSRNPEFIRNDGAEENPTRQHLKDVCDTCKGSRYCTILFSFTFSEDTLKNVTFPAEFTGEAEEAEEAEESEVSKEGQTYTKRSGDYTQVVTYGSNTFNGATYYQGSLQSVYEGTYSPRGITSYTSYSDASKRNMMQKINNITYDKNGNVQFYEQNSKKILLTGDADGCLIMDDENNARRFGHCAELFKKEKSSVLLQYDRYGFLKEAVFEGKDKKAYTFTYNASGKLTDYCEANGGKCHRVKDGKMLKDIIHQNIPETIGRFDAMYGQNINGDGSGGRGRQKMTREEALKRVKESGNKIKVKMR